LLTHIAPCCTPVPGDGIVGFVTRSKGVTIHCKDCPNITNMDEPERLLDVNWGTQHESYPASIIIVAEDRVGLLKDITAVISESRTNITAISSTDHNDGTTSIYLTIDIPNIGHLSRLLSKLEDMRGIISATRSATRT